MASTCEIPNPPMNGAVKLMKFKRNLFNSIIQFDCNVGYKKIGHSLSRRQTDGSWTNSVPSCYRESTLKQLKSNLTIDYWFTSFQLSADLFEK